jgi:hypothetical protein
MVYLWCNYGVPDAAHTVQVRLGGLGVAFLYYIIIIFIVLLYLMPRTARKCDWSSNPS